MMSFEVSFKYLVMTILIYLMILETDKRSYLAQENSQITWMLHKYLTTCHK